MKKWIALLAAGVIAASMLTGCGGMGCGCAGCGGDDYADDGVVDGSNGTDGVVGGEGRSAIYGNGGYDYRDDYHDAPDGIMDDARDALDDMFGDDNSTTGGTRAPGSANGGNQ